MERYGSQPRLVNTIIGIPPDVSKELKEISRRTGTSVSAIVREAVAEWLDKTRAALKERGHDVD